MNRSLFIITLSLILALLLTWPYPLHLSTHALGDGSDDPAILWNLWWVRYSLTELGQSPLQTTWMFWPIGINLAFYTLTTLNGLLSIPIQLAFGIVPANAFIVYFELVIAAYSMWLYVRWLCRHDVANSGNIRDGIAYLAAIVYAFGTSKWMYLSLGQYNIAASHWLPLAMLYFSKLSRPKPAWRETVLSAFFVLLTAWTEFTYASFFIQLAALYWLRIMLAAIKNREWVRMMRYCLLCATLAVLFTLGIYPILRLMIQEIRINGDFMVEGQGFANVFSNDLLGFFVPSNQHPLFGRLVTNQLNFAYLNFAYIGWLTLLLGLLGLTHQKTRLKSVYWALFAMIFGLLSLGPTLRINGHEWQLPMPFDMMLQIPFIKANRYPSRYAVLIAFCFAIMVAYGTVALLTMRSGRKERTNLLMIGILGGLLLIEHLGAPLPLSDYRVPEVYKLVKERQGAALLEIPLAWRNGFRVTGTLHNAFMFAQAFQTTHLKRLLSGNTSRNPEFKFQYFTELPFINSLLALETGKPLPDSRLKEDAAIAPEMLRLLDSPTLIVRRLTDEPSVTPSRTIPYLEDILTTRRWYDEQDYLGLEATLPPAPARYEWDGSHPLARLFFAEGWSAVAGAGAIYAEQAEVRLFMPSIAAKGDWQLRFEAYSPSNTGTILMADYPLGRFSLQGDKEIAVTIPATLPRQPLNEIIIRFDEHHAINTMKGYFEPYNESILSFRQPLPSRQALPSRQPLSSRQRRDLLTATLRSPQALPSRQLLTPSHIERNWPFTLLVESAGLWVGNLAHIYVNGVDLATNETGYHVALLSPEGDILAVKRFDTFNQPEASVLLATFIEQAPRGTIIAIAAADTVSQGEGTGGLLLGDEAVKAFHSLGASDLRGCYACSHALIGIKGSTTVREDASAIRPARVYVGAALHHTTIAARFTRFVLEECRSGGCVP